MVTDLVIVVPGITGSRLTDSDGREIWGPSPQGIIRALATFGGSIRGLMLPRDIGDDPAQDGVTASGLIPGFHVIPGVWTLVEGYGPLVRFLRDERFGLLLDEPGEFDAEPGNLILFSYDWRLSNRWTASLLKNRVETALMRWRESRYERADAKVVFICHSMGGLIARWYLDRLGGSEVARALVTIGTPHRGALKCLDELVNGVKKGPQPLTLDLTTLARSMPAAYQLLPEYACIEGVGDKPLKTTEVDLPVLDSGLIRDGMAFHDDLDRAITGAYPLIPVVGIMQPTPVSARVEGDCLVPDLRISGREGAGDGTVPRLAARPTGLHESDASIRGVVDGHGSLPRRRAIFDQLEFVLTADEYVFRAGCYPEDAAADPDTDVGVAMREVHASIDNVEVTVEVGELRPMEGVLSDEAGAEVATASVDFDAQARDDGRLVGTVSFGRLRPGGYTALIRTSTQGVPGRGVRQSTLVWDDDSGRS